MTCHDPCPPRLVIPPPGTETFPFPHVVAWPVLLVGIVPPQAACLVLPARPAHGDLSPQPNSFHVAVSS